MSILRIVMANNYWYASVYYFLVNTVNFLRWLIIYYNIPTSIFIFSYIELKLIYRLGTIIYYNLSKK